MADTRGNRRVFLEPAPGSLSTLYCLTQVRSRDPYTTPMVAHVFGFYSEGLTEYPRVHYHASPVQLLAKAYTELLLRTTTISYGERFLTRH